MDDLERFYLHLARELKDAGAVCAITGGLACIEFGVVEHTSDCDLLCDPGHADVLLSVLTRTDCEGRPCRYRGSLSAPLDARWLRGGWTAHFQWGKGPDAPCLDVFGVAPRMGSNWAKDMQFPYAGRFTVAAMKRTRRPKDWSQATALGLQLLAQGDERGWLHLFEAEAIQEALECDTPGPELCAVRPVLRLALQGAPLFERALLMEVEFWSRLDRLRLQRYERAARPYADQVRQLEAGPLPEAHRARVERAESCLPLNPVADYGMDRMLEEARADTGLGLAEGLLGYLPRVSPDFAYGAPT